jgi:hypothetical protein
VKWAHDEFGDADFASWVARNVSKIPGPLEQVGSFLSNISDWVRAGLPGEQLRHGEEFVTRPFTASMSLETVTRLSAEWHDAVASNMTGPQYAFPAPWYPAAKSGTYEIVPIDNNADLYREGAAMHHCVGAYGDRVTGGQAYVYSVRRDGERLATLALARNEITASLKQIRGPCNVTPPKEIISAVQRWLRAQAPLPPQTGNAPWRAAP